MPDLQEWIHKMEEGAGARALKTLAALLGFVALAIFFDLRAYKNFSTQEAMESAQLARNLAAGKGYTTLCVRPLDLYLLQKTSPGDPHRWLKQPVPDLSTPPAYPVAIAGLMKIFPFHFAVADPKSFITYQPERAISFFNQVLFFIAVVLIFRLALRLFDPTVAWLSAAVFAGTEIFWRFSISGISTMFLVVLFLGMVSCMVAIEQREREQPTGAFTGTILLALLLGIVGGIGGLTRYSFAWLMLPVLFFVAAFATRARLLVCLAVLLPFCGIMTPWLVRNYNLSGTLFGTATYVVAQDVHRDGEPFAGDQMDRSLNPANGFKQMETSDYVRKFFANTREILQNDLPRLGGSWITALFLVGLLLPFRNPTLSRLRIFLLATIALFVVVQGMGKTHLSEETREINSENLLVIFAPLVFLYGVALFSILLDQALLVEFGVRAAVNGLFWLVACAPFVLVFFPPRVSPIAYPPYWPPAIYRVANYINEKELMLSDVPWAVAWYGQRQCLWLPLNCRDDYNLVEDDFKPIRGLYLTARTMDNHFLSQMIKANQSWGQFVFDLMAQSQVPTGFPLREAPAGFLPDQLFLSNRQRW